MHYAHMYNVNLYASMYNNDGISTCRRDLKRQLFSYIIAQYDISIWYFQCADGEMGIIISHINHKTIQIYFY